MAKGAISTASVSTLVAVSCTKDISQIFIFTGGRLENCLIFDMIVSSLIECGQWCLRHSCQSLNYGSEPNGVLTCELNNCTNMDRLMLVDRKFDYYEMVRRTNGEKRCMWVSLYDSHTLTKLNISKRKKTKKNFSKKVISFLVIFVILNKQTAGKNFVS